MDFVFLANVYHDQDFEFEGWQVADMLTLLMGKAWTNAGLPSACAFWPYHQTQGLWSVKYKSKDQALSITTPNTTAWMQRTPDMFEVFAGALRSGTGIQVHY